MNNIDKYYEKFRNEQIFNHIVVSLIRMMEECQLSPSEVREAAMFAVIKFEMEKPHLTLRDSLLNPNLEIK